tara:strand:+ start:8834 stop:9430 length:597 start_codon:yes stop_codon:yes gene_type:complete
MRTLYLGPEYDLSSIKGEDVTYDDVAEIIAGRELVALFQGRSEAGPRALGNRSLLYDPRDHEAQKVVNKIKKREEWRPFAASVMLEYANDWFDMQGLDESPFMMYAMDARPPVWHLIPGVLHIDKTCRIQTVTEQQNEHYYKLIRAFWDRTSIPMLFNTSFNLAGQPLVETPQDAFATFNMSDIPYLYFPEIGKLVRK